MFESAMRFDLRLNTHPGVFVYEVRSMIKSLYASIQLMKLSVVNSHQKLRLVTNLIAKTLCSLQCRI